MNGAALGGFMSGLAGGANTASSMKAMQQPAPAIPVTDQPKLPEVGFGLGAPLVSGEAGKAQIAGQKESTGWASLQKIVSSFEPTTQPIEQKAMAPYAGTMGATNG